MSALGLRSLDFCRPPVVDISGQTVYVAGVDISGQTVFVDISGQTVNIAGQTVDISGQCVCVDISGQTVNITGQTVDISGQKVDISGQCVCVDISGQTVDITGQTVDISGQTVNISGQTVDISGQCVCVDISGQTVDISGQTVNISGQTVDISGQTVNIAGVSIVVDVSSAVITPDISGQTVVLSPNTQVILNTANATGDAFGRLRASNPYTLFEFNSITGKGDISGGQSIIDEVVNGVGASSVHVPNGSYVEMSVSVSGDFVVRQSHEYILYQPGKSKLIYMTGVLRTPDSSANGIISRIGAFDASMGVYFEYNNGAYNVVIRNGGPTLETRINRSSWNGDKLLDISFEMAQIYTFDFEWLGVGQVRCGIVSNGITRYYHTFTHVNELLAPYTTSAKLPLRYSIQSNRTGASGKMRMICGTVISEGGLSTPGIRYFAPKNANTTMTTWTLPIGSYTPIMSLRVRNTYPYRVGTIKLKNIDFFASQQNDLFSWLVVLNPTFSVAPTFTQQDPANSIAEICIHPSGTYTTGTGRVLYQNFGGSRTNSFQITTIDELVSAPPICVGLSGVSDVVTILGYGIKTEGTGGTVTLYGCLEWIELV